MDGRPTVSAIVTNNNGARFLAVLLPSLKQQDYPLHEIIIVDSGSTDRSREMAAEFGAKFVEFTGEWGITTACNMGFKAASGKALLFLNNDMRLPPATVGTMVKRLVSDGRNFAVDAKQLSWDGTRVLHGAIRFRPCGVGGTMIPFLKMDPLAKLEQVVETPAASGANILVWRERFMELGGFDEEFRCDFEDLDLCMRAWRRGWRILYEPRAIIYHWAGWFFDRRQLNSWHYRVSQAGAFRFAFKHFGPGRLTSFLAGKMVQWLWLFMRGDLTRARLLREAAMQTIRSRAVMLGERRRLARISVSSGEEILNKFFISG